MLHHLDAVGHGVERFITRSAYESGSAGVPREVLTTQRDLVQHRDRVVDVGQPVHPRQSRCGSAHQCLQAVAGALRLGAERPVGLPPRRYVRQLLDRCAAQRGSGGRLGLAEQRLAVGVGLTGPQTVHGQQQDAVVAMEGEHGVVDDRPGQELLQGVELSHGGPPTVTPDRHPARRSAATGCPPAHRSPWPATRPPDPWEQHGAFTVQSKAG